MKDTNHTSSLYAIKKRWKKRLSKSLVTLSGKESVDQTPHWSPEVWLESSRTYTMELFRKNGERLFFSYFI